MSEDPKKHDEHVHDDHAHADAAHDAHPAPADAHGHPEPAHADGHHPVEAVSNGHPDAHDGPVEPAHVSQEHPADPAISDHAEADAPGVDHPVAHADEPHAVEEPGVTVEPSAHDHHPEPAPAEPVHEDAPLAAAPPAAEPKRPVWSDQGDAPFEDVDSTPVYARKGKGGSGGSGNEFVEIIKTIAFALLIALVLRIVLFQPFTIPSASMEPNLYEGDYIVVSKWSYGYSKHAIPFSPPIFKGRILEKQPTRGDIVVFKLPSDNKTDYIKRLIGLPGDRIQMINNVLYLNGAVVPDVVVSREEVADVFSRRSVIHFRETLPGGKSFNAQEWGPGNPLDNTVQFEVPAGYYFMIGDNRDNSLDSREYPENGGVGLVPAENLVGKAEIILFSWSPGASLLNPVSWFQKVRPSRFFTVLK